MCLTKIMNNLKIYIVLNSYLSKNYKNQSSHKKFNKIEWQKLNNSMIMLKFSYNKSKIY